MTNFNIPVISSDKVRVDTNRLPSQTDMFMDLLMDDGFKLVFGEDEGKELMIGLLNAIIPDKHIVDLEFIQNQAPHFGSDTKRSVYDVQCKLADDSRIIVEVQRRPQSFFKDRILYYGAMPVTAQPVIGSDYSLYPVYVISFVDFALPHSPSWSEKIETTYCLKEASGDDILSDKLNFVFVELGRFRKSFPECDSFKEKLYFCLKYIYQLKGIPDSIRSEQYFSKLFESAALARRSSEERAQYTKAMTTEIDIKAQIAYAREEGFDAGLVEGANDAMAKMAKAMKDEGIPVETISRVSGFSLEQLASL